MKTLKSLTLATSLGLASLASAYSTAENRLEEYNQQPTQESARDTTEMYTPTWNDFVRWSDGNEALAGVAEFYLTKRDLTTREISVTDTAGFKQVLELVAEFGTKGVRPSKAFRLMDYCGNIQEFRTKLERYSDFIKTQETD